MNGIVRPASMDLKNFKGPKIETREHSQVLSSIINETLCGHNGEADGCQKCSEQ